MQTFPGLLDAHVHGQGGVDFADVGDHPEALTTMMAAIGKTGVSYVMATLVSLQLPTLTKALHAINEYVAQNQQPKPGHAQIVGVHLEGPFIAKNCKGAHDIHALQDSLSIDQFKEIIAHAPHIKEWKLTIDPELPGAQEFMRHAKELEKDGVNVKVFVGHSNPSADQIDRAVQSGVAGFTHVVNACMETCSREARPLSAQDAKSNMVQWLLNHPETAPAGVELIVDGVHLSKEFVTLITAKLRDKIMLVTDALGPAGLSDGIYKLGTLDIRKDGNSFYLADANGGFIMKDGTLPDGTKGKVKSLAGSAAPLSHVMKTYFQWLQNLSIEERMRALYAAVITNPRTSSLTLAAQQKLDDQNNYVIINDNGELVTSMVHGKLTQHLKTENNMALIYGAQKTVRDQLTTILNDHYIQVAVPAGSSLYQQERAFMYGEEGKGHHVAIIVFGDETIPFGVISKDINTKQLPVVVYIANETGRKQFEEFKIFLSETNRVMSGQYKSECFCFEKANYAVVTYADTPVKLIEAVNTVHAKYLSQPAEKRTVRQEAAAVADEKLTKKRNKFAVKPGLFAENMAASAAEFNAKLAADKRPTASYFGPVFKAVSDMCQWSESLAKFNVIYGMGGADAGHPVSDQSTMYQFAYYAKQKGARLFGVVPLSQAKFEKNRDFTALNLDGWYITKDLAERMRAFRVSDVIIIGSCGTGTYEEVFDILRATPDKPCWIINNDGSTTSLIHYLTANFNNITVINNKDEFMHAVARYECQTRLSRI